jgi:cytochrome c oxidase assembly factor CtaG
MSSTLDAFLRSWPFDPWLIAALLLPAFLYLRGWMILCRRDPERWHGGRLAAFWGGLTLLFIALGSPIEPFASLLLQVHMLQHLLLMMFVPPLLWLGTPLLPLLRGLPRPVRIHWIVPILRSPMLRRLGEWLTHPARALPLFVAVAWIWHAPALYEIALRSNSWHYLQHLCFLAAGLLFWYPVVRPHPSRPRWSRWLLVPYLLLADVQNTALSALLTFANRVLYPYYAETPRLGGMSALEDQAAAGVLMWVPGSLVFLLPLFALGVQLMSGQARDRTITKQAHKTPKHTRMPLPLIHNAVASAPSPPIASSPFDALRLPLLGRFLRWRHARLAVQLPLLMVAIFLICDGLRGPQVGSMNLAGVLPWIHWRGLLILGLLSAGNVFCMACPFTLPRTLARRLLPRGRPWPRWLRSKWPAVLLLALFLWAYEGFALWDSPWWTAWLALGYFAGAFAIDVIFRGGTFCKYVCPIGQFNFVQALVSPLEVKVREPHVCRTCQSKDCLRGRDGIPGCELDLFAPRKTGNLDCTFCLDCIHACPHENIGISARLPASELWREVFRSGVGRLHRRPDVAALVLVLVFGAFANAAGMVAPIAEWRDHFAPLWVDSIFYLSALLVMPFLCVGGAAVVAQGWGAAGESVLQTATRYCFALVPLGFAMWLAHYSFHFLTSYDTLVPVTQRFAGDLGASILGEPSWVPGCCRPVGNWLLRLEILILDFGLLLSLYTGFRIASIDASSFAQVLKRLTPWAVLILLLFSAGVWIVLQPMQMRGTP